MPTSFFIMLGPANVTLQHAGVIIESTASGRNGRAIIIGCTIKNNAQSGVVFKGSRGLGRVPHVIAQSDISGNAVIGISFVMDWPQGTSYPYADIGVWIDGNSVEGNGHGSGTGERGGIRVKYGGRLYRPIALTGNDIRSNIGTGSPNFGAAVLLSLAGAPTTPSAAFTCVTCAVNFRKTGNNSVSSGHMHVRPVGRVRVSVLVKARKLPT